MTKPPLPRRIEDVPPEVLSEILRSPDTGPDAPYPTSIAVYCDTCGLIVKRDYLVTDRIPGPDRLELARSILRTEGWSCTDAGDVCPPCQVVGRTL